MVIQLNNKMDEVLNSLKNIEDSMRDLPKLELSKFDSQKTAFIFVDVIEGFVNIGNLSTDRAIPILPYIQKLNDDAKGHHRIYFADTHPKYCTEFLTYPEHCIKGTAECDLVKELVYDVEDSKSVHIPKNCTNGFLTHEFQNWLKLNPQVNHFIITGLVTDICVMQFALTLKAYFDQIDQEAKLFIPIEAVETFDISATHHMADLMNLFALYNMRMNGINLMKMS